MSIKLHMAVSGHRKTITGATPFILWSSSTPMRMLKTSQKLEHIIIISINAIHQCAQFHTHVYEDGQAISAPPKRACVYDVQPGRGGLSEVVWNAVWIQNVICTWPLICGGKHFIL